MTEKTMFASNSLIEHVARGALGLCLLTFAIYIAETNPIASVALGIGTLFLFRGCPVYWTLGLIETINLSYIRSKQKKTKKAILVQTAERCSSGSTAR